MQQTQPNQLTGGWIRNNDEKEVYHARNDKQIRYFKTNADVNTLLASLTKWRLYLGIREQPSKEENILNVNFIREMYPTLSVKDIDLAIKWSLQGKLGIDIECYGRFSPLYISKVLNTYTKLMAEMMNDLLKRKEQTERMERSMPQERSPEQIVKERRKLWIWFGNTIVTSNRYLIDPNNNLWNFLNNTGNITPDKVNFEEAFERAKVMTDQNIRDTMAKVLSGMSAENKKKEYDKLNEMNGRFIILKDFFRGVADIEGFFGKYSDEDVMRFSEEIKQ